MLINYKKIVVSFFAIIVSIITVYGCDSSQDTPVTPEQALKKFYESKGAEDQLMDPLILGGSEVVPLIVNEIKDKDMDRRRYAIGALGNIKDESAIPALKQLLNDKTEKEYFRCDALNAIGLINFEEGRNLAKNYQATSIKCLADISHNILTMEPKEWEEKNYMKRNYSQALAGRHE